MHFHLKTKTKTKSKIAAKINTDKHAVWQANRQELNNMLHRLVFFHCNYIEKWLIIMLSYLKLLLAALHGTSVKGSSSDRTLQVPLNYSNNRNVTRHHLSTKLILDNMFTYTHSLLTSKSIPNQHLFIVICLCACS